MTEGSRKAVLYAFFANLGIAITKFIGFLITASVGLLAESVHSLADTGNQALLLLGGNRARKAADREHPFGYGRERYFWAFVVALVLFSMGGLFALYEGIEKIRHPHEVSNLGVAIGILVVAIVLESISLRTAYREASHVKDADTTWWRWLHRSKQPELPVVLLEDVGAEIGLFFALTGVLLAHFTDEPRWDAVGSVAIGVLLVVIAIVLAIEMKGLLIGEAASERDLERIVSSLEGAPDVRRLIHLKTQHLGPEEVLVAAKLEFSPELSIEELAEAIDGAEAALRAAVPMARVIYLEPDVFRARAGVTAPDGRRHRAMASPGLVAMLLAVLVFSSSSSIVKWADTPGAVVAFWRMVIAVILWWIVIVVRRASTGRPAPTLETWRRVLPAGLLFGLNITIFFTAINNTSIAHAEFITALSPLALVPLGALLFHEKPDRRALMWAGLTLVGLAMVLFLGGDEGGATVGGDALVVLAVATWVSYLLTSRQARGTVGVVDFMTTMMLIGMITATPMALILAGDELWPLTARGWIAVSLLAVLTGMLGHGLIVFAQHKVDVGTISIIQVAQPAIAVCWGYLLLGEAIRPAQVPGMILVICGLVAFTVVSQRRLRARATATMVDDQHGELTGPVG